MDALLTSKCVKFIGSEVEWAPGVPVAAPSPQRTFANDSNPARRHDTQFMPEFCLKSDRRRRQSRHARARALPRFSRCARFSFGNDSLRYLLASEPIRTNGCSNEQ